MDAGPRLDTYRWSGGAESMLRFGRIDGPLVIVAMPLFEEANRTRALIVAMLRSLAGRGIGGAIPDLPGQGESVASLSGLRLSAWQAAFAGAVEEARRPCHVVGFRGGALIDGEAPAAARLHVAPVPGRALVRDLLRARRAASLAAGERPVADELDRDGPPLLLAGNLIERNLLRDLMEAAPIRADRTVTIFPDREGDRALAPADGPDRNGDLPRYRVPWHAAEPVADRGLAEALAADVADWIADCAGC